MKLMAKDQSVEQAINRNQAKDFYKESSESAGDWQLCDVL
jgi:hypothetical protein